LWLRIEFVNPNHPVGAGFIAYRGLALTPGGGGVPV
jgi:hypothetical protein